MDLGSELIRAREHAGLSREQLAERSRLQLAKIEALEQNAFERLPEGAYLHGLIRAYAREVGLDGDALVTQVRLKSRTVPPSRIEPYVEPPADPAPFDSAPPDDPPTVLADYRDRSPLDDFATETAFAASNAGGIDPPGRSAPSRLTVLALLLLAGTGWGLYLYERMERAGFGAEMLRLPFPVPHAADDLGGAETPGRTDAETPGTPALDSRTGTNPAAADSPVQPEPPAPADRARTGVEENRTTTSPGAARDATERPAPLPPTASGVPPIATRDAGAQRAQSSSATRPDPPASTTRPPADGSGRAPGDRTGEVNTGAIVGARPPDSRSTTGAASNGSAREVRNNDAPTTEPGNVESRAASTSPPVTDVTGIWTMSTELEPAALETADALRHAYRLELQQRGSRVTGKGQRVYENGDGVADSLVPIVLQGEIDGNRLTLTFVEHGAPGASGRMVLHVVDYGLLRGRYSTATAQSGGIVEARRPGG